MISSNPKSEFPLKGEMQKSVVVSVNEQTLLLTKLQTQKNIKKLQKKIKDVDDREHEVMKKLLNLRAALNDSLIQSINDQAQVYIEAITRRKRLENERQNSAHNAISKELDIQVERDNIREDRKEVMRQMEDTEKILQEKKEMILKLEKALEYNAEIMVSGPEAILEDLINKIREARSESLRIEKRLNPTSSDDEDEKETFSFSEFDLSEIKKEKIECDNRVKELQNSLHETQSLITQLIDDINNSNAESPRIPKLNTDTKVIRPAIQSPRMTILNRRIAYTLENIEKHQRKVEKKNAKIKKRKELLNSLLTQLDLPKNRNSLKLDTLERIERSLKWLTQMTNTSLRSFRQIGLLTISSLNEWDTKVLLASINEAEDLYIRYSLLCK